MARSRRGLRARLIRSYLTVIASVLGILLALYGLVTGLLLRAGRESQIRATGILAREIARSSAGPALRGDRAALDASIGRMLSGGIGPSEEFIVRLNLYSDFSFSNVFIVDRSSHVVYAYREGPSLRDFSYGVRRGLLEKAFLGAGTAAYFASERRSVAAQPIVDGGDRPVLALFVESPASGGFLNDFAVLLAAGGVFLIAASILSGFLATAVASRFARLISGPLCELAEASRTIAEGGTKTPPVFHTGDEIERLSVDIQGMTTSLSQTMDGLHAEREKVRKLLKMKQDLVENVSHDLRTPLASMKSHLETMEGKDLVMTEEGRRYLAIVRGETDRLENLVEDLFLLTRMENAELAFDLVPVPLSDVIPGVCTGFGERAMRDKKIEVLCEISPDCPPVIADRQRLGQVLGNLLSNAIRYTPEGGIVRVAAFREGDKVRLEVRDTGIGIFVEDLPHVFDRFYMGDKSRNRSAGGSGLGLAIVKDLVEKQGGSIGVESVLREGTVFSIFLKIAGDPIPPDRD